MEMCTIIDGPSKFDIMASLLMGEGHAQPRVTFHLQDCQHGARRSSSVEVRVWGLEREGTRSQYEFVLNVIVVTTGQKAGVCYDVRKRRGEWFPEV